MSIYLGWPVEITTNQWPCSDGYHIPTVQEWTDFLTKYRALGLEDKYIDYYIYAPRTWYINYNSWSMTGRDGHCYILTCEVDSSWYAKRFHTSNNTAAIEASYTTIGCTIRAFKDTPVTPDSSRIAVYQGSWSAGIFLDTTNLIISISSDGTNWQTLQDRNVWATERYIYGGAMNDSNMWLFFQWWNNYGFKTSVTPTFSSTKVDVSSYWPSNPYTSSTFIQNTERWTSINSDLWWWDNPWVVQKTQEIQNIYVWEKPAPVRDYISNTNTNTGTLSSSYYYWIYFTPKVNCTLDKILFLQGNPPIWNLKITTWYLSWTGTVYQMSSSDIVNQVYTLSTPMQLTAWVQYWIWVQSSYSLYYNVGSQPVSWTNVTFDWIGTSWNNTIYTSAWTYAIKWILTTET